MDLEGHNSAHSTWTPSSVPLQPLVFPLVCAPAPCVPQGHHPAFTSLQHLNSLA